VPARLSGRSIAQILASLLPPSTHLFLSNPRLDGASFTQTAGETHMSLLDSVKKTIETRIDELSKRVEAEQADAERKMAEAENEQAKADMQSKVKDNIEDLKGQIEQAKKQLVDAKDASEDQLKELQKSLSSS
jgi:wobble nucleotide-excising tRNase